MPEKRGTAGMGSNDDKSPQAVSSFPADGIEVSRLLSEAKDDPGPQTGTKANEIVAEVRQSVGGAGFRFDEALIKASLEELLVALVALRDDGTHGKQVLDDLAEHFETMLSPGTVYPALHDLSDDGLLEQRELVKTKEYVIDGEEDARRSIAVAARQHLAMGFVMHQALEEFDD